MPSVGCRLLLRLNCRLLKLNRANLRTATIWSVNSNSNKIFSKNPWSSSSAASGLNHQLTGIHLSRTLGTQVPRPYVDPKLSYVFGRSNEHLIYSTISRELDKKIKNSPDEVPFASYFENKQLTFREIDLTLNKIVKALVKQFDVKKGDYVGVYAYNCINWILVQLACSRIGAILTPINPSYKAGELAYVLKKGKVKCLFMPGPKSVQTELNNHLDVLQSERIVEMSKSGELNLRHVIMLDGENDYMINKNDSSQMSIDFRLSNCQLHNWSDTENDGVIFKSVRDAEDAGHSRDDPAVCIVDPDSLSPDDIFAVYYTSGTTGTPKGACISQFTVVNNVRLCQLRLRNGRQTNWNTTIATTLPMFHIFAGVLNSLSPILNNAKVVYSSYKYDIKVFVESIIEYQSDVITLTPTILIDMLAYIERKKLTNLPLKIIQVGGAAMSPEVAVRTFKVLPSLEEVRLGYGSTENGAVSSFQTIHEPSETRTHSVGPPIDFTEIRIVNPGTDQVLPHGEKGEVQTRGFNTMVEYLDDPKRTEEVITPHKWYRTGDIGFLHPHGSLQLCGRLKHMIIKGGENIYPEEVEQLIHTLDYVEDVHVIGVPDERFGEQVCAWVKLKADFKETTGDVKSSNEIHSDDIIKFCRENITYFKVPRYVLFVDEFPMTPTKKVQNHIMTEMSCKILGLKQ